MNWNKCHNPKTGNKADSYQITILGELDETRCKWFAQIGFETTSSPSGLGIITILTGQIIDQPHLRSILNALWDLNLKVLQVSRLDTIEFLGE